jgi:hypothetical protein
MRSTLRTLLSTTAALAVMAANATVYYVSASSGVDSNNGTSQSTPWRTIDRVNQSTYSIVAGDQILFQRGGVYRGEIIWGTSGTASAPVVYGAYGTGADPIVSGAKVITGWVQHSGNIYKAYVGMQVDYLYVGGARMTLARTPNAGSWYRNTSAQYATLTSTNITQASGYFTGARCVVRSTASSVDTLRVTNQVGSTLTFGSNPVNIYMNSDDWGFFLENKLTLLDAANEWYYDKASGYLYLWAPGNVNPTTLNVEASVYWSGVNCYPSRHYGSIQNLDFKYQRYAGVLNGSADHVTVTGCTMEDLYHGIRSYGSYDNYSNNTIRRTYATGCLMIDNNSLFENNNLTDIALTIGMGETGWGYFGIRGIGVNNTIRGNRFNNIGYTPIAVDANHLVEKNILSNYCASLNDGGGIAFDNADGMIIQDNVVRDVIGGLDGSSTVMPHYQHLGVGIYFGNTNIINTTVQRNTVYNIPGVGINVDHMMNSVNYKVKYNTMFNCDIGMSISDFSTTNGPNAVPPYYVANFNDEYTGNVVYSLTKDQLCVRFYNCHGNNYVDFGTFTNNQYFNPYDEMSIFYHNLFNAFSKTYSLEMWQGAHAEETGSSRSPLRLAPYSTVSELTGNLVTSGDFTATDVSAWSASVWPSNATVSRVTTNLDNGCLKANIPNNTVYASLSFRNPEWFPMVNGQWYRMRMATQSNAVGAVNAGAKAQSTMQDPYSIYEQLVPFTTERRDVEFYFQSNITDNAQVRFLNDYTEPMYYLDNVDVRKVTVQAIDPTTLHKVFANEQTTAQSFSLPAGCWSDLAGVVSAGGSSFTLQPYTSKVFYKVADSQCGTQSSTGTVSAKIFLGGCINWTTNLMNDGLRTAGLIPATEPYTALGYTMENPGAAVTSTVLNTTGNSAPVDWVILELKSNTGSYPVAARRACIVRRDGTVITPDGNTVITFATTTTAGKYLVIHHRNHLGVMTSTPISTNGQNIDFTTLTAVTTYGTDAMQINGSRRALYSGNVNSDNLVKYTGTGNDRDLILTAIGSTTPTNSVSGYRREDVNMDGVTKYTGTGNDRDPVLTIIGGTTPTAVKTQQVP